MRECRTKLEGNFSYHHINQLIVIRKDNKSLSVVTRMSNITPEILSVVQTCTLRRTNQCPGLSISEQVLGCSNFGYTRGNNAHFFLSSQSRDVVFPERAWTSLAPGALCFELACRFNSIFKLVRNARRYSRRVCP